MDIMNVEEYKTWIGGIARRFKQSQIKAATAVNVEMLKFYWSLGADIVRLEKDQPWGSKFMQRVSADLKAWMPEAKCFSVRNLQYMRLFVELYGTRGIAQQPVAQLASGEFTQQVVAQISAVGSRTTELRQFEQDFPNVSRMLFAVPWGHHVHIMDKFKEDQRVDMLFYNVIERRYYVIEVKVRKFDPADIGQIGTYMVAVNHQLKRPDDQQTVGLIICREKDRVTVQYALESSSLPIGVSDYVLERFIPADFKSQMPTIEEVEGELTRRMEIAKERRIGVSHTEV